MATVWVTSSLPKNRSPRTNPSLPLSGSLDAPPHCLHTTFCRLALRLMWNSGRNKTSTSSTLTDAGSRRTSTSRVGGKERLPLSCLCHHVLSLVRRGASDPRTTLCCALLSETFLPSHVKHSVQLEMERRRLSTRVHEQLRVNHATFPFPQHL